MCKKLYLHVGKRRRRPLFLASNQLCRMDVDEQAIWRATGAVFSVVINADNGEGLFAPQVLKRAITTISPKN